MKHFALIIEVIMPILLGLVGATLNPQCAPTSGAHLGSGSSPTCTCQGTAVTCNSFKICGIGNANANILLQAGFVATVQCKNKGGQIVEVKTQTVTASGTGRASNPKNGCLVIPSVTANAPSAADFTANAVCPNPNWKKLLEAGSQEPTDFTYEVTFVGFNCPFVSLTGSCS
ncbi:hypothetical protein BGZ63DRAFT_421973 [Mariannaea sp. PMI_226]|nr:hypothetical protein BGZ63DRAFT_421973 [Mariannaea sp. PMI_226]